MKPFKCKHCGEITKLSLWQRIIHPHLFGKLIYAKCDKCKKRSWLRVYTEIDVK